MSIELTETAEDVSSIAFGFMASKALFAGLHIDVFSYLADGSKTTEEIASETDIPKNRVETLMTALNSIGLVDYDCLLFRSFVVEGWRFRGKSYSDTYEAR